MIDIIGLWNIFFNRKEWLKQRIINLNVKVSEANNKNDWIIHLESLAEEDFIKEVEGNCLSEEKSIGPRGNAARESLKHIKEYKRLTFSKKL